MGRCQRYPAVLALLLALGCGPQSGEGSASAEGAPNDQTGSERDRMLGPFLSRYWDAPLPPQGAPPEGFVPVEASLDPARCGGCHPDQYAQWRTSLHAAAFSPGFAGQLIEGALAEPDELRSCQSCHAPLGEQQPFDAALAPEPGFDPALRGRGLVCAGCHVRAHRRYGPPRRPGLPPLAARPVHGGFEERPEFQQSRFCAPCHQFFDDDGVNGKPLENTWREWRDSPQAAQGRTCQSCHMPDRQHLWRGIHDAETVRAAVDVELLAAAPAADEVAATLLLTNRDVGHAFPSYVTPRVRLALWQVDAQGAEIEGTRLGHTIGREIDFGAWQEVFDTRVLPGESARLDYRLPRHTRAAALLGRVTVDPDHHYRGVFAGLLPELGDAEARRLIAEAHRRSIGSSYVLAEFRREL